MSKPTELIIATFPGPGGAAKAEKSLREQDVQLQSIALGYIAILTRNAEGDIDIEYTSSPELQKRTVFGGIAGTLAATLLAGPVGFVAGAAAAYGAVNALPQLGLDAADVHEIARELKRDTSALVLLENAAEKATVVELLQRQGASVGAFTVTDDAWGDNAEPRAADSLDVAKERAEDAIEATKDALTAAAAAVGRMVGLRQEQHPPRERPTSEPEPVSDPEPLVKMEDERFVLDEEPLPPPPAPPRARLTLPPELSDEPGKDGKP